MSYLGLVLQNAQYHSFTIAYVCLISLTSCGTAASIDLTLVEANMQKRQMHLMQMTTFDGMPSRPSALPPVDRSFTGIHADYSKMVKDSMASRVRVEANFFFTARRSPR